MTADLGPAPAGRRGMSGEAIAVHEASRQAMFRAEPASAILLGEEESQHG